MTVAPRSRNHVPASVRARVERARRALGDRRAAVHYDWLQALSGASPERVADVLSEVEELLPVEEGIRAEHRAGGRPHYAQFRAPFELYALVRLVRPIHIVETGVSSGVSSAHLLLGVRKNGRGTVHSIDFPIPQHGERFSAGDSAVALPPGRSSGWVVPPELRASWDLRIGPSERVLPRLVDELSTIGLFLHDSRHTYDHMMQEYRAAWPCLRPGGWLLSDDVDSTFAFLDFARAQGVRVVAHVGNGRVFGLLEKPGTTASGSVPK